MNADGILILGDLCWDVNVDGINAAQLLDRVGEAHEVSVRCESRLDIGGSAWLFAKEVLAARREVPLMIAVVGCDPTGDQLIQRVAEAGLSTALVQRSRHARTDLICVARFMPTGRLMLLPNGPASDDLSPEHVRLHLDRLDPQTIRWAWISGYALVDRRSARYEATNVLTAWCHANGVRLALDLVPHDFRSSVGSLEDVVAYLGGVDLLVGAPSTLRELGYGCAVGNQGGNRLDEMRDVAKAAAARWGTVLVQAHTGDRRFGQVLYDADGCECLVSHVSVSTSVRGAGDRLAVQALRWLDEHMT